MPTKIGLDDRLAESVAALAARAGQPAGAFVERVLQGLVDADIGLRDGIPAFRMPPEAPVLTSKDVDRLLQSDLDPRWTPVNLSPGPFDTSLRACSRFACSS